MSFRSFIGSAAVIKVQKFMSRYKGPELIEKYVKSNMLYHKDIPFLYRVFKPTEVPSSKEEGGYKVVSTYLPLNRIPQSPSFVRSAMDHSKTKLSSIPCSFILVSEGSSSTCRRLHHREGTLSGYLPLFAPQCVCPNYS